MPQTYLQTAVIEKLSAFDTGIESTRYELIEAPVAAEGVTSVTLPDKTTIYWAPHCIYKTGPDNLFTTWYNKPTLKSVLENCITGSYFQFNSDDTVIHRYKTRKSVVELWWSPPIEAEIIYNNQHELLNFSISTYIEKLNYYFSQYPPTEHFLDKQSVFL